MQTRNSKGQFVKGFKPWNKGKKGIMPIPWNKGKKYPQVTGSKNPKWKGDKVGYSGIHKWVYNHFLKPNKCEHCGRNPGFSKNGTTLLQWANKSGKYLRKLSDWLCLCISCHALKDNYNQGEKHFHKLTEKQVLKIHKFYKTGKHSQRQLAKKFNVTHTTIGRIIRKQIWTHI